MFILIRNSFSWLFFYFLVAVNDIIIININIGILNILNV